MARVCIVKVVGLTPRLLKHAPNLARLGSVQPFISPLPAVTFTSQATMLTGTMPNRHGVVANGWLFRETQEVRFWQQMHSVVQGETLFQALKGKKTCLSMAWSFFALGSPAEWYMVPRPFYGADGSKAFGIIDTTGCALETTHGAFPFHSFWGPGSGLASTEWIAAASATAIRRLKPDLSSVYMPHLDYDLQRFGPDAACVPERVREVDQCVQKVIVAAQEIGAQVVIVSEYGLVPVKRAVSLNQAFRKQGWLAVRDGPYGETLLPYASKAFAVVDHQLAHIYIRDLPKSEVRSFLLEIDGVDQVVEPGALELDHSRAGELVALAKPDIWFNYYYWLDERRAPDFAHTVDIHRKPGYDPCELFMTSKLKAGLALLRKKLGFRYLMDVVPLQPELIKGSHGLHPSDPQDGPLILGPGAMPKQMQDFKAYILDLLS